MKNLIYRAKYSFRQFDVLKWIFIFPIIGKVYRHYNDILGIDDSSIVYKHGLLTSTTELISLSKVEGVYYEQSLVDKLFKSGTVLVSCGDVNTVRFNNVLNPAEFVNAINSALKK